jgi:GNAT superfamily N-acetyltransferase
MRNTEIHITEAAEEDAAAILALQKLAYLSEAGAHDDFNIPPLRQTLDETRDEFERMTVLKAVQSDRIIGSVRGYVEDGTCFVGKLIVAPEEQNKGLGTRLLHTIEERFAGTERFELFTGHKSARNLYLYQKLGYSQFKEKVVSPKLTIIFLEKIM